MSDEDDEEANICLMEDTNINESESNKKDKVNFKNVLPPKATMPSILSLFINLR